MEGAVLMNCIDVKLIKQRQADLLKKDKCFRFQANM